MRIATSKTNITLSRKTTTNSRLSVDYTDFNFATIRLCQILRLCRFSPHPRPLPLAAIEVVVSAAAARLLFLLTGDRSLPPTASSSTAAVVGTPSSTVAFLLVVLLGGSRLGSGETHGKFFGSTRFSFLTQTNTPDIRCSL